MKYTTQDENVCIHDKKKQITICGFYFIMGGRWLVTL